jgi:hypothetical protein
MIDFFRLGLPLLVEFEDGGVTHRWVLFWLSRSPREGWSAYLVVDPSAPMPAPVDDDPGTRRRPHYPGRERRDRRR